MQLTLHLPASTLFQEQPQLLLICTFTGLFIACDIDILTGCNMVTDLYTTHFFIRTTFIRTSRLTLGLRLISIF